MFASAGILMYTDYMTNKESRKRPDDKAVLTIYLDKSLRKKLKIKCAEEGVSMSEIVIRWIEKFLG